MAQMRPIPVAVDAKMDGKFSVAGNPTADVRFHVRMESGDFRPAVSFDHVSKVEAGESNATTGQ